MVGALQGPTPRAKGVGADPRQGLTALTPLVLGGHPSGGPAELPSRSKACSRTGWHHRPRAGPGSQPIKAYACRRYGPPEVLERTEQALPDPRALELRVRIHASTVNTADARIRALNLPRGFATLGRLALGISGPRRPVLGLEAAGVVDAVGRQVTRFKPGDRVVAFPGVGMACHAEYRCLPEDGPVALAPPAWGDAPAAALCFGGVTMLDFYRRADLRAGERVLVNGASGTVGSASVQLARHFGARVWAVCGPGHAAWITALGADEVIDPTRTDFTRQGQRFDVIVDAVGNAPWARSRHALARGGRLVLLVADLPAVLAASLQGRRCGCRVIAGPAREDPADVARIVRIAEAGGFMPAIDSHYAFDEIREAHRRVDGGRKRGSVVLQVRT